MRLCIRRVTIYPIRYKSIAHVSMGGSPRTLMCRPDRQHPLSSSPPSNELIESREERAEVKEFGYDEESAASNKIGQIESHLMVNKDATAPLSYLSTETSPAVRKLMLES